MRGRLKGRLTYANVMSTLAVFGMLATGSAFAASQIGTKDIKNGAVTASKLHNNGVTTEKITNGAVTTQKIKHGAVTGANVASQSLTGANVASQSLTGANVASQSLTGANVASQSLTGANVASQSLTGANIIASSLGTVPSANHATDADHLGGSPPSTYRVHCPSGMTLVGTGHDLCVDSADRATGVNWLDGANTCASAGLRLPSIAEALEASFPNEHYWTDDIYNDGVNLDAWQWYGVGLDNAPRSNLYNVRCVTSPSDA